MHMQIAPHIARALGNLLQNNNKNISLWLKTARKPQFVLLKKRKLYLRSSV